VSKAHRRFKVAETWTAAGATAIGDILVVVFFLFMAGTPFSWSKFGGGFLLEWVELWSDYSTFSLGISEARASWALNQVKSYRVGGHTLVRHFQAVLGRLGFACQALDSWRPFFGPLYAWLAAVPGGAYLPFPKAILLVFGYMIMELVNSRVEEDPFRTTACLELLATFICVMILFKVGGSRSTGALKLPGLTDNKGNTHAAAKLMTTKPPLTAIHMELSAQLKLRKASMKLRWVPRDENTEADDLTNNKYHRFDEANRIHVALDSLPFRYLPELLKEGEVLYQQIECLEETKRHEELKEPSSKTKARKKRQEFSLGGHGPLVGRRVTRAADSGLANEPPMGFSMGLPLELCQADVSGHKVGPLFLFCIAMLHWAPWASWGSDPLFEGRDLEPTFGLPSSFVRKMWGPSWAHGGPCLGPIMGPCNRC
jgi:hypothetical protein